MAKVSIMQRQIKREKTIEKYRKKREFLKEMLHKKSLSRQERTQAMLQLSKLPRNSSPVRSRRRCKITGRARGVYRRFEVCRHVLRELINKGLLPGVVKASW